MERRWTKGRGGWAPPSVSPAVSLLPTWEVRIASSQPGWASQETLGLQSKYLGFTGTWGRPRILRESLRVQPTAWQARGEEELGLSWVDTKPKGEKVVVVGPEHFILEGLDHRMRPRPRVIAPTDACTWCVRLHASLGTQDQASISKAFFLPVCFLAFESIWLQTKRGAHM